MATPKKRTSPVRSGNRRRNLGIDLPATTVCTNCKSLAIKHTACAVCGFYKGRAVLNRELPALKTT